MGAQLGQPGGCTISVCLNWMLARTVTSAPCFRTFVANVLGCRQARTPAASRATVRTCSKYIASMPRRHSSPTCTRQVTGMLASVAIAYRRGCGKASRTCGWSPASHDRSPETFVATAQNSQNSLEAPQKLDTCPVSGMSFLYVLALEGCLELAERDSNDLVINQLVTTCLPLIPQCLCSSVVLMYDPRYRPWMVWPAWSTNGSAWTSGPSFKPPQRTLHSTWRKGSAALSGKTMTTTGPWSATARIILRPHPFLTWPEWWLSGYRLLSGSTFSLSLTSCRFSSEWSSRAGYWTTFEYVTAMKHKTARLSFWKSGVHENLSHCHCRTVCYHGALTVGLGAIYCLCACNIIRSTV